MTKVERGAREFLSTWQFWMVLAFFGLASVSVYSIQLSNRQAREEAVRIAAAKAANTTQVAQCFAAVKNAPITSAFIAAHEAIIDNGILANEAALAVEPPGDPLRTVRVQSLARLRAAKKNANDLSRLVVEMTPTKRKCIRLAGTLGVDASPYLTHT